MKNRYFLCLLICGALLYLAIPKLSLSTSSMEGIFAISWLAFACIVIAGNLSALLFVPKKERKRSELTKIKPNVGRVRSR